MFAAVPSINRSLQSYRLHRRMLTFDSDNQRQNQSQARCAHGENKIAEILVLGGERGRADHDPPL
jgi:hypothetical protein